MNAAVARPAHRQRRRVATVLSGLLALLALSGCSQETPEAIVVEPGGARAAAAATGSGPEAPMKSLAPAPTGDLISDAEHMTRAHIDRLALPRDARRMVHLALLESLIEANEASREFDYPLTDLIVEHAGTLNASWAALGFSEPPGWDEAYAEYVARVRALDDDAALAERMRVHGLLGAIRSEIRRNILVAVDSTEFSCRAALEVGPILLERARLFHARGDEPTFGSTAITRALAHQSWRYGFERMSMMLEGCDKFVVAAVNRRHMPLRMPRRIWGDLGDDPDAPYLDAALAAIEEVFAVIDTLEE